MRKMLATMLCSALLTVSSFQMAAAAEHHEHHGARAASHRAALLNERFRNSNNEQLRAPASIGVCGLFPGPCQ